jgi:hypothetical protein
MFKIQIDFADIHFSLNSGHFKFLCHSLLIHRKFCKINFELWTKGGAWTNGIFPKQNCAWLLEII